MRPFFLFLRALRFSEKKKKWERIFIFYDMLENPFVHAPHILILLLSLPPFFSYQFLLYYYPPTKQFHPSSIIPLPLPFPSPRKSLQTHQNTQTNISLQPGTFAPLFSFSPSRKRDQIRPWFNQTHVKSDVFSVFETLLDSQKFEKEEGKHTTPGGVAG